MTDRRYWKVLGRAYPVKCAQDNVTLLFFPDFRSSYNDQEEETHSRDTFKTIWRGTFQNKYYKLAAFSSAQNKTKGVLILVNWKLNLTIEHLDSDEKGRFVFIRCKIYNNRLALVSIYGPNETFPYTDFQNSTWGDWLPSSGGWWF